MEDSGNLVQGSEDKIKNIDDKNTSIEKNKDNLPDNLPPEIRDVIREHVPDKMQKEIFSFISHQGIHSQYPPIFDKFTPEHISKMIENAESDSKRTETTSKRKDRLSLTYFVLGSIIFVFIILYLAKDSTDIFYELLKILVLAGGGFGAGYGYKAWKTKSQ